MADNSKQATGRQGEETALNFLLRKDYRLLDRNWRFGHLELDLVFETDNELVFVEVKTRTSLQCGGPLAGMTPKKIKNILACANAWLDCHQAWNKPCRFDVICLIGNEAGFLLEHYVNAIDFTAALDSGDASGQSW